MINKTLKTILFSGLILTGGYLFNTDQSTIVNGMIVEQSELVAIDQTIKESFIITSVENGIIRGEQISGKGEGIYYILNELDKIERKIFSNLSVNDLIRIEWTKENYNNSEWYEIENVVYNKSNQIKVGVSE